MITLKLLKEFGACQEGIKFFQNNKLEGYPLNILNEIKGDYGEYVDWLKNELNPNIIREHDDKGNLVYKKNSRGYEYWYDYDERNNLIHKNDSKGYEVWYSYDENNNLIHWKDSNGYEVWSEYDLNNNKIHSKDSYRSERRYSYDENNNLIHSKDSHGNECLYKIEYYEDEQLKSINNYLEIPWFTKTEKY